MTNLKGLATVVLTANLFPALLAERRCPGAADGVPLRQIEGALIVAPVSVNGSGPFDFLIDSGAQITTVDTQLAAQLGLQSIGSTGVSGVATSGRKSATQLARMEIGSHHVESVLAVIEDMAELVRADAKLHGIVGEDFLTHFDFLIDYEHRALCLDESGTMAAAMRGPHLPLAQPYGPDRDLPFTRPIVIAAQLEGRRTPTLLCLDSGSSTAVLFAAGPAVQRLVLGSTQILKRIVDGVAGTEQDFAVLQPQPIAAAGHALGQISFVQPMNTVGAATQPRVDGILPTAIFKRVFVSYSNRFAILEP